MQEKYAKRILVIIFVILLLLLLFIIFKYHSFYKSYNVKKESVVNNISYELEFVKEDLKTYGISERITNIITSSIEKTSKEFNLPIGLLHAIFRIESDYKFMITHPAVNILINGKQITTNAIGLGGVIWDYWKDSLQSKKIAMDKQELYLPDVNIRASGYILRFLINDEINKKHVYKYNILLRVVTRYYGAYSDIYLKKMEKVTSDLWMKRIAKELLQKL